MKKLVLMATAGTALLITPPAASAEWILTPFVGASFAAGSDNTDFNTVLEGSKRTYGGSIMWSGGGVLGFEIDLAYAPKYFGGDHPDIDLVDNSNYTSLMANVVFSAPRGAFRPYATAGGGIIKTHIDVAGDAFDISSTDLGFNVGAGVSGFFTDRIGIRGDMRYFRQLKEADDGPVDLDVTGFSFWRGSVGVSFRF